MDQISFHSTREDADLASRIADRALNLQMQCRAKGMRRTKSDFLMDILATNNSCPLDLARLIEADDFNFAHDVFGIERHLNRTTGQLENCFLPRFAR